MRVLDYMLPDGRPSLKVRLAYICFEDFME